MLTSRFSPEVDFDTAFHWFLLSLLAGSVNAGGMMACGTFVSHVTGFSTLAGMDVARGSFGHAIAVLSIPSYFLAGVVLSAYLTEVARPEKRRARFALVMVLVAVCLSLVSIGGAANLFGIFGAPTFLQHDYLMLALLCGACGLQNAVITSASGATIRTTHLTGLTTDLGIGIVRAEFCQASPEDKRRERKANLLRMGTVASFFIGSAVGAILFIQVGYYGFFFSAALALYAAYTASREKKVAVVNDSVKSA